MKTRFKNNTYEFLIEETPTRRNEPGLHMGQFSKVLQHAFSDGEHPDEFANRIATERNIPVEAVKTYVAVVWTIYKNNTA